MLASWTGRGFGTVLAVAVAFTAASTIGTAEARTKSSVHNVSYGFASAHAYRYQRFAGYARRGSLRHWASVLQCVPFARENSGIELTGNAGNWWENAEGLYQRGSRPEVGSILNFRASGHMRMGHVAVVTNVVDSRHIEIDHANWSAPGRISRDMDVVDVSPNNDWTSVRVALDRSDDEFGSTYSTYGFIYDRPDNGVMVANAGVSASAGLRTTQPPVELAGLPTDPEEVAEADDESAPRGSWHRRHAGHYRTSLRVLHARYTTRSAVYRVASHTSLLSLHHRRRS